MASKILVADDSITIRKIVAMAFENEDETVEGVSSGNEALEKISTFAPDIVLADIEMPELNGFALSHKIKSDPALKHIKVLLLASDLDSISIRISSKNASPTYTYPNPSKSDDVINKIRELLADNNESDDSTAIELSEASIINPPPEGDVIALSADDAVEEEEEAFELSAASIINDDAEDENEGTIALQSEDEIIPNEEAEAIADDEINPDETSETVVDEAEAPRRNRSSRRDPGRTGNSI